LIGAKVSTEAAHHLLLALLPNDPYVLFNFHVAALKHGQQLCVWGTPKCAPCPLKHLCDWYQANMRKR
jgi:endonuclease-3